MADLEKSSNRAKQGRGRALFGVGGGRSVQRGEVEVGEAVGVGEDVDLDDAAGVDCGGEDGAGLAADDDMDGDLDSIAGCRSELHGTSPKLRGFSTRDAEFRIVATRIRQWLESGVQADEIAVATRSNWPGERIREFLAGEQLPVHLLSDGKSADTEISVGTMHRVKGLEFRCLVVVGSAPSTGRRPTR
ncbi:hypothetical protein [Kutzneria sp. NPDC051319]|uniref:hypothetical protein n=1 Tax=Kutzneria sp. NPDC051319 TaxID=3155047 RepID=UPI0034127247